MRGSLRSRPVSRILSWMTISLGRRSPDGSSGAPGSLAGSVSGACFALHRTGFGKPPRHRDAGGLLPHLFTLTLSVSGESFAPGGFLSVPLSIGFRRLGFPQRPALRCPDFPRTGSRPARGHPACTSNCSPGFRGVLVPEPEAALGAAHCRPRAEHELPAGGALEADAAHERNELLVERPVERGDHSGHSRRKTPTTLPRISTCRA